MKIAAAILAAGSGVRFGQDKTQALLGGKPVWRWSFDAFASHPLVEHTFVVAGEHNASSVPNDIRVIAGGETRQESSRRATEAASDYDILLLHDAARPFVTRDLITRVIDALADAPAAAPALQVTDTIRQLDEGTVRVLDRQKLFAMQTPQGVPVELLRQAHERSQTAQTDDIALVEALGYTPKLVEGDPRNFKITVAEDLERARAMLNSVTRTGLGYDIHAFSEDPDRTLMLGGLAFPGHRALDGHSDADVLLHAITDALLGAAALGDIGQHFPNTDPRWHGEPSINFLRAAAELLARSGFRTLNIDATLIAESPKIMSRSVEMREVIAKAAAINPAQVSVKATTNEGLGAIGRREGISAFAIATVAEL